MSLPRSRRPTSVAMKRDSSLESDVSASASRVTKRLKIAVPHASARIPNVTLPKRSRLLTAVTSPSKKRLPTPDLDDGASSGGEADDEIDTQSDGSRSRVMDMSDESDAETEVDEDDHDTGAIEMSIVQFAPLLSSPCSLPATPTSFPSLPSFPRFGPAIASQGFPASPLLQVEDMLLTPREGAAWAISSSSEDLSDDYDLRNLSRKRKRKAVTREGSVSGVDEAMPLVRPHISADESEAGKLFLDKGVRQITRGLNATVSGVTAGLQALPPLHKALLESGSDTEMLSLARFKDTDDSETDTMMKDVEVNSHNFQSSQDLMAYLDTEPLMTLDQFSAYRTDRIAALRNPPLRDYELVGKYNLRGQNIQLYLAKLGYILPIPLGRAVARNKRDLRKPLPRRCKPITQLTGNLREDLLVRLISKYRRELIKGYNKYMTLSVEQASYILAKWHELHLEYGVGLLKTNRNDSTAVGAEETPPSRSDALVVPVNNGPSTVYAVKAFARKYTDRLEAYEPIYPEAPARYTRALISMLNDRFPAWDRWWADERRFALHRSQWGLYDAETERIEREAREMQDNIARRRRATARCERLERLGFGGAAMRNGMGTRMERDEAELIEQAILEARIQQFRALVNAPPVTSPRLALRIDVQPHVSQEVVVVPASPPPSYNGSPPSSTSNGSIPRTARTTAQTATHIVSQVFDSPPRLPSYQPNTYRRGISPPPPPPFNARTDAMPVPNTSCALQLASSDSPLTRRLLLDGVAYDSDSIPLPGAYLSRHRNERVPSQLGAPAVLSGPAIGSGNISAISTATVLEFEPQSGVGIEEGGEPESDVEDLDDLLGEVEEEDVEEQEQGDRGRERVRSACVLM
ncbi:hypothetical protein QFC19_004106 [Naganishia cerealis]|uniref:Uncharacterized protein n=1 Tax=Naganishia cerealis TaxID=610337 RepID=A0ACC2VXQ5_9TREE|nr:hypothetical protein QFC19_004106 [Naganishia cerealis]